MDSSALIAMKIKYIIITFLPTVPAAIFANNSTHSDSNIHNSNLKYGKKDEEEEGKTMKDRDSSGAQDCFKFNVAYEHGQKVLITQLYNGRYGNIRYTKR